MRRILVASNATQGIDNEMIMKLIFSLPVV